MSGPVPAEDITFGFAFAEGLFFGFAEDGGELFADEIDVAFDGFAEAVGIGELVAGAVEVIFAGTFGAEEVAFIGIDDGDGGGAFGGAVEGEGVGAGVEEAVIAGGVFAEGGLGGGFGFLRPVESGGDVFGFVGPEITVDEEFVADDFVYFFERDIGVDGGGGVLLFFRPGRDVGLVFS